MNPTIVQAIREKRILSFSYNGHPRTVEPHALGVDSQNNVVLRGWQLRGQPDEAPNWRHYKTGNMLFLQVQPRTFAVARDGHEQRDEGMIEVFAQL